MNFSSDVFGRYRRFTGGKSRNLPKADGGKGIVRRADELCGIALMQVLAQIRHRSSQILEWRRPLRNCRVLAMEEHFRRRYAKHKTMV